MRALFQACGGARTLQGRSRCSRNWASVVAVRWSRRSCRSPPSAEVVGGPVGDCLSSPRRCGGVEAMRRWSSSPLFEAARRRRGVASSRGCSGESSSEAIRGRVALRWLTFRRSLPVSSWADGIPARVPRRRRIAFSATSSGVRDVPRQRHAQSGIFARNTQRNATNEFRGIIHSQRKVQIPTFSENISVRYLSFSYLL